MLKALPTVSKRIFLRDMLPEVADMEGKCKEDERAYCIVRQATEGDLHQIAQIYSRRQVRWEDDSVEEIRNTNLRDEWAWQAYLCLCETGNLFRADGSPAFEYTEGSMHTRRIDGAFDEFLKVYGSFDPAVTRAIRLAIWDFNPTWDARPPKKTKAVSSNT